MLAKKYYITLLCLFAINFTVFSQTTKISFEVLGMCGMCKDRIESALDIKGVKYANWSVDTKICNVTFNAGKISEKEIHKILADAGHDTKICRAPDEAYNGLHQCCHYERAAVQQ
tara:strand:+ start:1107 stop:1451 length:345 start_codon:yes stop_codon:yes gene_type:complete